MPGPAVVVPSSVAISPSSTSSIKPASTTNSPHIAKAAPIFMATTNMSIVQQATKPMSMAAVPMAACMQVTVTSTRDEPEVAAKAEAVVLATGTISKVKVKKELGKKVQVVAATSQPDYQTMMWIVSDVQKPVVVVGVAVGVAIGHAVGAAVGAAAGAGAGVRDLGWWDSIAVLVIEFVITQDCSTHASQKSSSYQN